MSDTQKLAERIARLLETEQRGDLTSIFASLEKINQRLDNLESVSSNLQTSIRDPQSIHPSQDKFAVFEAFADEIVAGMKQEKTCTFEPNGRPCDHCSMCSSRGF